MGQEREELFRFDEDQVEGIRRKYSLLPNDESALAKEFWLDFPWIVDEYCRRDGNHSTVRRLANALIKRGVDKSPAVVRNAVYKTIELAVGQEERREIGRIHQFSPRPQETRDRMRKSAKGASIARGEYPFNDGKVSIGGREYSEIEYIVEIKDSGKFDYRGGWMDLFASIYEAGHAFPIKHDGCKPRTPFTIKSAYGNYKHKLRMADSRQSPAA